MTPATTWTYLEGIMLREIYQPQKGRYCVIPLRWGTSKSQMEMGSRMVVGGGCGGGGIGSLTGTESEFCKMKGSGDGLHNSVNGSDASELCAG